MADDTSVLPSLRERCKAIYQKMQQDAILRQGNPVDDLLAFVVAEIGRSADPRLDKTLPLVVYFGEDRDREEFIAAILEANPGFVMKRMP